MAKRKEYPHWVYKTHKEWLLSVRKRWVKFRKVFNNDRVREGCAYYPPEVYEWLRKFKKMDAKMKKYYKNA